MEHRKMLDDDLPLQLNSNKLMCPAVGVKTTHTVCSIKIQIVVGHDGNRPIIDFLLY